VTVALNMAMASILKQSNKRERENERTAIDGVVSVSSTRVKADPSAPPSKR
jgi:hypothetical protein